MKRHLTYASIGTMCGQRGEHTTDVERVTCRGCRAKASLGPWRPYRNRKYETLADDKSLVL